MTGSGGPEFEHIHGWSLLVRTGRFGMRRHSRMPAMAMFNFDMPRSRQGDARSADAVRQRRLHCNCAILWHRG